MGRIQSNVGLITGIPITDTINQLLGVASQPHDILSARTQGLQQEQLAINTLSSRVLSLKFDLDRLKVSDPFQSRTVSSSKEDVLSAVLNNSTQPPLGSFSLRPAQPATSQQLISQRFDSVDDIQSAGTLSFGSGGFLDKGISLDDLNNGQGVARGEIKITDLDGNSSIIDLSLARTVDEVIETINNDSSINVTASTDGDRFTLVDNIGSSGTLSVQEVNGGTTAADLGLASITSTTQSEVVLGDDVYGLHSATKLSRLNDGNGVRFTDDEDLPNDLLIDLQDGTTNIGVDLSGATTLGDIVDAINSTTELQGKLTATIASDGNRIELNDATTGSGTFVVRNGDTGSAADDLGLTTASSGGVISGRRLISGLRDTLVSSLNGGRGIDQGSITIFDRNDDDFSVDLSSAETLSDVVDAIDSASATLSASINASRNGITITDNSGGNSNLRVLNSGGTTATDLGIEFDAAESTVNSGSLSRQTISEATLLSSLNGGEGITPNDIRIFDTNGDETSIDLNSAGSQAKTVGDVIDAINAAFSAGSIAVQASINAKGDGILLTDTGVGNETFRVEDVNGSLAADLNLTGVSQADGNNDIIDGTTSFSIDLSTISTSNSGITLDSLNNGAGINRGDIRITDSAGTITSIDLNGADSNITTVEQLIDAINSRQADVTASINGSGTGIAISDNANGQGTLVIEDITGSSAADLKILSTDSTTTSINGTGLFTAQTASQGALNNVATEINNLNAGITASVLNDGQGFRLQLVVDKTGSANEFLIDAGDSGFSFTETSKARDALLVVGAGATPGSGVLVSSATNEFTDVIEGIDLTTLTASDTPVEVTVAENDQEVVDLVQSFVDSYNSLRDDLGELTSFNEEDLSTGLLFGTTEALRVDTDLSRLVTNRYLGLGSFSSLQEIGISVDDTGKLSLNQTQLKEAFAEDAQGLQNFFTATDDGVVDKFNAVIDRLTNSESGVLTNRDSALRATIELNEARIEDFNESLERQRARLELQFFQLEQVIAGLQANQQAIGAIQAIPPLSSTSRLGQ